MEIEQTFNQVWQYVITHGQDLADYGTFISAIVALVVAVIALRQLRLNRLQVLAAKDQVDVGQQQVQVAIDSLDETREALRQAGRARLDSLGPQISIVPRDDTRTSITDADNMASKEAAFDSVNVAQPPVTFKLRDPSSPQRYWSLHFSGEFRVRNYGENDVLVAVLVDCQWDGSPVLELDHHGRYVLPPGENRILRWYDEELLDRLMQKYSSRPVDDKTYIENLFSIYVYSSVTDDIFHEYSVEIQCLPVFEYYPSGSDQFKYDAERPRVTLQKKVYYPNVP